MLSNKMVVALADGWHRHILKWPENCLKIISTLLIFLILSTNNAYSQTIRIGSKNFNESYILAEIMAQLLQDRGYTVERIYGLGGTMICYQALVNGEIDVYPEYSGTIEQAILKLSQPVSYEQLQNLLKSEHGLELLDSFGFNNTYAITVRAETAKKLKLKSISDLQGHRDLRFGLSYEFLERTDGWGELAKAYSLSVKPLGMEHGLSYQALDQNQIDGMDVYSTDAEIQRYDLVLLKDDKNFFPKYLAAPFVQSDLDYRIKQILQELSGKIDETEMQRLNALVAMDKKSFAEVAQNFLLEQGLLQNENATLSESPWVILGHRTWTHITLTAIALIAAMGLAIPFGILIYRLPAVSRPIIYFTGLLQTIPSIALLALMIPLFGIGAKPAIVALFLYALLPILRSTFAALNSIDPILKKVSVGMGLTVWQRLRYIEIPLATPNMLAGIRTASVINIGTATLAAFIGAGGLGEPIVTGLSLNDPYLIMWGAIPAAILAIIVELIFEGLERLIIPRHLLQKQAR
jgi:osmoprotectant transport system permease protein